MEPTENKIFQISNEIKVNRKLFLASSLISVLCLVGSFGEPLLKLTVYRQDELGLLNQPRQDTYIITENTKNYPFGFVPERAKKIAQIREDGKYQKIMLLVCAGITAAYGLTIADSVVTDAELEDEVKDLETTARKELLIKKIKLNAALLMKEQALEMMNKLQGLFGSYGEDAPEFQNEEADEMAATDKHYEVMNTVNQGHSLEYAISQVYGLDKDSDEFKNVLRNYLEE